MEAALLEYLKKPEASEVCGKCTHMRSQIPIYVYYRGKLLNRKYSIGYCQRQKEHVESYKICSMHNK